MVQTVHLQLSQICSSLRLLPVYVMLTVCLWPQSSCRFTNPVILLSCTGVDVLTYTFPFMMSSEDLTPMVVTRSVIPVAAILAQLRTLMHKHMHVYTRVLTVTISRVWLFQVMETAASEPFW